VPAVSEPPGSSSSIVAMMQPSQAFMREEATGGYRATSAVRCSLPQSEMRAVFVVQLDNATPIILNREKSVTFGTLGTLALWLFTKPSSEMGELFFSVASMRNQELGSWRSHNGCSIRWPAAVCPWRRCPRSAAVRCRI
jgi:hypothetical protein